MMTRRQFGTILGSAVIAGQSPAIVVADTARPSIPQGVASGEVTPRSAVIWSRTDRPSQMIVEYSTTESFKDRRRVVGPVAFSEDDFTAKTILANLPAGQSIFYRVLFKDLTSPKTLSIPSLGRLKTPSLERTNVRIAWGGDTAGQGYGIDAARGGMKIYEAMRNASPDVFIHSGDTIYADNPIPSEIKLDDGSLWKNLVTEETSKVAETLNEFRGRHRYNMLDENVRRFNSEISQLVQWDDHETTNNWYPGEQLDDPKYKNMKSVDLLAARGRRAFFEYTPTRRNPVELDRVYRAISRGPLAEVFLLDQRTYRGPNSNNRQAKRSPHTAYLGQAQLQWLVNSLKNSKATWKIIASDMPISLIVGDGPDIYEALANGEHGAPSGRELEFAWLFRTLKEANVHNLVWLTADVHYAAAHHYDPSRAKFTEFDPFWEFVAGPLNAGTFGPGKLDMTFGPELKFKSIPDGMKANRPPSEGLQFFGTIDIDAKTSALAAKLHNIEGKMLYSVELPAQS
jgi:alkaline phosphatase D